MSRFNSYDGEEGFQNQSWLWERASYNALHSKRGHRALAELRAALLALPEKRLIAGALCTVGLAEKVTAMPDEIDSWRGAGEPKVTNWLKEDAQDWLDNHPVEGVCAVGAYIWHQRVKAGADPAVAFAEIAEDPAEIMDGDGDYETADAGRAAGLAYTLAWELAYRNDELFHDKTPEQRYDAFIEWIDKELAKPTLKAYPRRQRKRRTHTQVATAGQMTLL